MNNLYMFNNIFKVIISVFALIFITNTASAQDPAFSQFYANPLYLNPAFAGTNDCPRVNLNFAPFLLRTAFYGKQIH